MPGAVIAFHPKGGRAVNKADVALEVLIELARSTDDTEVQDAIRIVRGALWERYDARWAADDREGRRRR